jgi:hypothetical protein
VHWCDWQSSENFQVSQADPIEFQPLAAVLTHFDMHTGGAMTVLAILNITSSKLNAHTSSTGTRSNAVFVFKASFGVLQARMIQL